jgi:hypothetical protein
MLDLAPLAGAWGTVTERNLDRNLIGKALQLAFPQPQARTVAAAGVRGNEQSLGMGIANAANVFPPAADGLHRKRCRVVVNAHGYPSGIVGKIVNPVGDRSAQFLDEEVVNPHLLGIAFRTPLPM